MWCEWLVLIFPDWCLGTQRVSVCVWVLEQEDLITRKHICPLCLRLMLWCSSCINAENFLSVFCRSPCKQIQNCTWLVFLVLYLGVQSTCDSCTQTMGKLLSRLELLESCWKVILKGVYKCRSLDHTAVSVGKDRNPGAHLFHLTCSTLWELVELCPLCVSVGVHCWW